MAALAWASPACGPAPDGAPAQSLQSCTPEAEGTLDLGVGRQRFEAVAEGDDVAITPGFQGGYHLYGSVRAKGVDPTGVRLDFLVCQDGQRIGQRRPLRVDLVEQGDQWAYVGVMVLLYDVFGPLQIADRETTMAAQVVDRSGARATDTVTFTTRCCDERR